MNYNGLWCMTAQAPEFLSTKNCLLLSRCISASIVKQVCKLISCRQIWYIWKKQMCRHLLKSINVKHQEIIKKREWIPHIASLTKIICLKLFLDIVPSSSEDITRAMRGQPKPLSRITWEKWRERHFICFGFVSYRRCFLHSQPPFCAVGHFVCFSARLAVHYFAVYSVLGS